MSLFKKLFLKQIEYEPLTEIQTEEEEVEESRDVLDVTDSSQRKKYVESFLEQMRDSAQEIDRLKDEYRLVNAYLKDMEEIEALPPSEKEFVEEHAKAINALEGDRSQLAERNSHMAESDYRKMDRMREEAEEGIKKLQEAEDYQEKIKKDLQRLEGEKHACKYRMEEARIALLNMRGMAVICVIAAVACLLLLILLQTVFSMDAKAGYLLMAIAAALVLTILFVKYKEADRELRAASGSLNKVILLQNKVKIRYVNNTNLLDYYYMKYNVGSAKKLAQLWEQYQAEKVERQRLLETEEDLEFHSAQLVKLLKRYRLFDPIIWLHQTQAILDKKEMVEVRHSLILRRQNLRKQMDYNSENGKAAKNEIMTLVKEYPKYAREILGLVSDYEKRYQL
ncbi:MAG: hypothetical protein J1E61_09110 [Lachnospiraceae bacterium]|nr:hypothetical protein [Lachnospiraceae bacterium]